jgi:hypothetical protein
MTMEKTAGLPQHDQGGSEADGYEQRQIPATRERVPQAEVLTFPGGHLTTSEHPDLLAAAIRDIAARHGVDPDPPSTDNRQHETLNMEGSP